MAHQSASHKKRFRYTKRERHMDELITQLIELPPKERRVVIDTVRLLEAGTRGMTVREARATASRRKTTPRRRR